MFTNLNLSSTKSLNSSAIIISISFPSVSPNIFLTSSLSTGTFNVTCKFLCLVSLILIGSPISVLYISYAYLNSLVYISFPSFTLFWTLAKYHVIANIHAFNVISLVLIKSSSILSIISLTLSALLILISLFISSLNIFTKSSGLISFSNISAILSIFFLNPFSLLFSEISLSISLNSFGSSFFNHLFIPST